VSIAVKQKLKVGIAGYGLIGKRRRVHIDLNAHMQTVAVCDRTYGGSGRMPDGVRYHADYRELLREDLDVLFVSLPNYLAPDVTIAGLRKGLHVFCEKPPGRTVEDVKRVLAVKEKHPDLKLKYGFNHRYHDSVREALRILKSGRLGDIVNVRGIYGKSKVTPFEGSWRSERKYAGGGILLDQGIHMVDLMRLFCGEFVDVKSFVSNSYWKCDVEDNAYAVMRDRKGRVAMLHSSATQWQHKFSLEIYLAEGYLELQGLLTNTKSYGEEKLIIGRRSSSATGTEREEVITYIEDNSWRDEIDEFATAIVGKRPILNGSVEDALETMRLVYAIYWSDPEWRTAHRIRNPLLGEGGKAKGSPAKRKFSK
jgi:predicted dehydrogenase